MTLGEKFRHVIGILLIAGGFVWLGTDARFHQGQIAPTTAVGTVALCLIGGWLVDMQRTIDAVKFLGSQAGALWRAAKGDTPPAPPSVGGGS